MGGVVVVGTNGLYICCFLLNFFFSLSSKIYMAWHICFVVFLAVDLESRYS